MSFQIIFQGEGGAALRRVGDLVPQKDEKVTIEGRDYFVASHPYYVYGDETLDYVYVRLWRPR